MNRIRSFLYRFPRFSVDCRMDFIREDSIVLGVCYSLSESGLRGSFAQEIATRSKGVVTLYFEEQRFEVPSIVSGVHGDETRMRFQFESEKHRAALRDLLKQITDPIQK